MGNLIFSQQAPPITQRHELYGYRWQPNQNVNNALRGFDTQGDHELPAGIVVGFIEHSIENPGYYFNPGPVFNPTAASRQLISMIDTIINGIEEEQGHRINVSDNTRNLLQGYLEYTNNCLNWIYATPNGRALLDALRNGRFNVNITPSLMGNSYTSRDNPNSLSFVARKIMDPAWRSGGSDQETILRILASASNENRRNNQYRWLADTIKAMPLYSLFKTPPYEYNNPGFLATLWRISKDNIEDWFTRSINSRFAARLENHRHQVKGVKLADFIRAAVIIALNEDSPAGNGCGAGISFNLRVDNTDAADFNLQRPPAIGLVHELVHAYHNARGRQPGREYGHFTTCLAELLCVGLGPWANNVISENGIRAQWPPNIQGIGQYDNGHVGNRNVYEPTADNNNARKQMRTASHTF